MSDPWERAEREKERAQSPKQPKSKTREAIEKKQQEKAVKAAEKPTKTTKATTPKPSKSTRDKEDKTESTEQAKAVGKRMYRVGGTGPTFKITMKRLQERADDFFSKSGLPSASEVNTYLKAHPGARNKPGPWKAKDSEEALNRMGYAASEMAIGGAVELGLPFSLWATPPLSREADRGYRVLGGILTPSPADLLASQVISKLSKSTAWKKITGRYGEVKVTELEKQAAREIEKLKGPGQPYSTAEIRKGVNKVYRNLEDVAEFYRKHPELATPERSSAGAAQVPKVVTEFEDYLDDIGWDMDEYLNFMKDRAPTLPAGAVVNIVAGSMDRGTSIDQTAESLKDYVDTPEKFKPGETPKDETEPTPAPPGEEPKEEPITVPTPPPPPPPPTPTPPDEPDEDEPPPPGGPPRTPTPRLSAKDQKEMNKIRLKLYHGPVEKYEARFKYKRGPDQTLTIEARSFVEAMNKAQRARKLTRQHPATVELIKRS